MGADRRNLAQIKAKWASIKDDETLTGHTGAFKIAMWAAINVDYLIALAERNTSQDEMTAEDYEAIYGWGGQG